MPGGKEKYWEQVMLDVFKNNYNIFVRECQDGDIIEIDSFKELKEYFIKQLEGINDIRINSPVGDKFTPYILNVSFRGVRSEVLLHMLEEYGIFVSTGSACSSKSTKGSHVLMSIGLTDKEVDSALRFSFCDMNTKEEVDYTVDKLKKSLMFLRRIKK